LFISDDVEERLKKIAVNGFTLLEHELQFIPLPYLSLLKSIFNDDEQNEDNIILTVCKHFNDKYQSFLKDNKYNMITRLTLPLFYVTLIKIDGRPLKELVFFFCFYYIVFHSKTIKFIVYLYKLIFCTYRHIIVVKDWILP